MAAMLPGARPAFARSRALFLRLLGLVYLVAFASLTPQVIGLIGDQGLLPASGYLERVYDLFGADAYRQLPTLLWLWPSDGMLLTLCWVGIALSVAAMAGLAPISVFALLWLCYLSLTLAGQDFLSFQWDILLLEAGALAVLYSPPAWRAPLRNGASEPSAAGRWLIWGLAFKLTFLSGATKLLSGDPTWWGLTALDYHYETQPIPSWVSWYAHNLPEFVGHASVIKMFAVELVAPFALFLPVRFRRARIVGFGVLCSLQVAIVLTGNYGFFNLLTVVLYASMLDDDALALRWRVPASFGGVPPVPRPRRRGAGHWVLIAAAAGMALLSTLTLVREIRRPAPMPAWSNTLLGAVAPFRSVSGYGLFRSMTTERPEIVIEGSADGTTWREYPFRWKAGDPARAPGFVQPHMPRLDWQMWFAALDPQRQAHWLLPLAQRLLENDPLALGLLDPAANPFPDEPPRYVRLLLYRYRFTTPADASDDWWARELLGPLTEPMPRP
ncbi:MAG: lipase maturation factor family protein [Acidobacteria bacterium]|nr:lipase maturation factor family protein [Acidobacteriota bacterium]MYJ04768.1 lipase maturation factor family protein [Acidobacteriota bacterium]